MSDADKTTDPNAETVKVEIDGKTLELPVVVGTEGERGIDITKLRGTTGYITLDPGYRNTGSVTSNITFIDGEKGVLRYRGYPIEEVCQSCSFLGTAWLLIYGELPTREELDEAERIVADKSIVSPHVLHAIDGFPDDAHPMAKFSAMIQAASCYYPGLLDMDPSDETQFRIAAFGLISQARTLAAAGYQDQVGAMPVAPKNGLGYCENFLYMLFSGADNPAELDEDAAEALDLIFTLHADHEQNCSTSTVRMVGSSGANLFASCSAGVSALWGPLHGGANVAVLEQLTALYEGGVSIPDFMEKVKKKEDKLFGFGHGVYRNFDPRAKILKSSADKVLAKLGVDDPLLDIAKELEATALADDYFVSRKLYPNVDFYSGIIMRALGIPENMFTVIFAIGRMPGWIAQWKEVRDQDSRIYRPRQIYTGPGLRKAESIEKR